ncbi:kinase-like domain-containing protein [Rhizophagus clarus]|uniref:Kinase-like domain-containing protein n=1 Tax=Rhizophagus clarus TaxID=94130 RepID=A0A8H3LL21_9GLOM|nr:kinase-like domain-containing protein [Rhizophagus clarus]
MEKKPKNLWKNYDTNYQHHITISAIDPTNEDEEGGFGKVYSAERPEGNIDYWDIEKQIWIKSHLQIYLNEVISCFGITQDPNTKEYMMVLFYCDEGNLRNYINESETYISYRSKIDELRTIAQGLLDIHNSGFVHKDFHSEKWNNEIIDIEGSEDSEDNKDNEDNEVNEDNEDKEEDNEDKEDKEDNKDNEDNEDNEDSEDNVDSENSKDGEDNGDNENNEDSEDVKNSQNSEIYSQVKECDEIRRKKFESKSNKDKSINIQTHPQAIYTSRLLNFKNLPKPVNSSDLSSLQFNSANPCSAQLSESELNEFW